MSHPSDSPATLPPPLAVLRLLMGKWISQAVSTAARLGLAEHLAGGPLTVRELAALSSCDERALRSLLRALASVGVFAETETGRFTNSPLSQSLRRDVPGSMHAMALLFGDHPTWEAWGELQYTVRTGLSSFEHVNGARTFEYFRQHPEKTYFDEAFSANSALETAAIHRAFDFSELPTLVDVGGGQGAFLASILARNPQQRGTLFDQPHVVAGAGPVIASFGVADRVDVVGGSFFEEIPTGAAGYLMKHVVFNWNDERAAVILKNVRRAMSPESRLFIIDPVIVPGTGQTFEKFLDLEMRVLYEGAGERTEAEFQELLGSSGLELTKITHTDLPTCSILEARPRQRS